MQWSDTWDEVQYLKEHDTGIACGPDVYGVDQDHPPEIGILGFTHVQLLHSEWVENDTLTVKFLLEVRPDGEFKTQPFHSTVGMPDPSMQSDMEALLQNSSCSDIELLVQDDVIPAHRQILCALGGL